MCEMLAAAWPHEHPFSDIRDQVGELERLGVAGFGWGVAWLGVDGIERVRGLGRYVDEGPSDPRLASAFSSRFVVHLRRPSRLSTVSMFDTQPFVDELDGAWCHNGLFTRSELLRSMFAGELNGAADSEVGWAHFREQRVMGLSAEDAMRTVDQSLGGAMNLAHLGADGALTVYSRNDTNALWTFRVGDGRYASTALHSDDESVFNLVFPDAIDRHRLLPGTGVVLAEPRSSVVVASDD
jgi:predicted glutamine amidotransferase